MPNTKPLRLNELGRPEILILGVIVFLGIASSLPGFSNAADSNSEARTLINSAGAPVGIRQLSLATNDLIYDPVTQRIYASVPSSAGVNGNSITPIDPVAGTIGTPVFVGSEPRQLEISDNSQYIYAALEGSASVRRFDIATQTAGLEFTLGTNQHGPLYVNDMAVAPGNPNALAVARRNIGVSPSHAGVAIYDNGIARAVTTPGHTGSDLIEFSSLPTTLYGAESNSLPAAFRTMLVNDSGVSITSTAGNLIFSPSGPIDIDFENGLIYTRSGQVIDPEQSTQVGILAGQGVGTGPMCVDIARDRIYFLTGFGTMTLKEFSLTTFRQTGSLTIPGVSGAADSLIKWGNNGLAFRTFGNQVFLLAISDIVPLNPTPLPSPVQVGTGVTRVSLATRDLVYDSVTQKVYASLPSTVGTFGNSLAPIDPETGIVGTPVFVGSEPGKLAISETGRYIYAALDGAGAVRKFDSISQAASLQLSLGLSETDINQLYAEDISVLVGNPNAIAVSRRTIRFSSFHNGVAIYDDGIKRPDTTPIITGSTVIEPSASASTLYGYNNSGQSEFGFRKMAVTASGITVTSNTLNLISGTGVDIKHDNGVIYASNGRAINPEAGTILGTFPGVNTLAFVPNSSEGRIYFATSDSGSVTIQAFDLTSFLPVGAIIIDGVNGIPLSLIRWGSSGLAFRTSNNQVYFIKTSLRPVLKEVRFDAVGYLASEGHGRANVVVNRTSADAAATVTYSTSDAAGLNNCNVVNGIASSRCDYATSIGTVQFAVGETTKTISIPVVDDSYAEVDESFTITLSSPNGAVLGSPTSATVTIYDNENVNGANPIDQTPFFVRQQYVDFLGREPDPAGFAAWQNVINNCPAGDTTCDRIHVSSAFFRSAEFQGRGYFIYRFYPVAFGRKPDYVEFIPDLAKVSGFLSDAELEAAKVAFITEFMSRPAFATKFNGLNDTQYVDTLLATAQVTSPHRDFWIAALGNGTRTRATVLRDISESPEVYNKYYNQAFVVMQYFGYLRRDPDALYLNWIAHLDSTGDYRSMINGFMNSLEYRFRFGP